MLRTQKMLLLVLCWWVERLMRRQKRSTLLLAWLQMGRRLGAHVLRGHRHLHQRGARVQRVHPRHDRRVSHVARRRRERWRAARNGRLRSGRYHWWHH